MPKRPVQVPVRPGLEHLFGRHINHDPASKMFTFRPEAGAPITSADHTLFIKILLQTIGSCTGNAMLYALATDPFYSTLSGTPLEPDWTEEQAEVIYSAATRIDPFDGEWPPVDTGSDGNSVNKVARNFGWTAGWEHANSLDAALSALGVRPIMIGVNWYDSMLHTTEDGGITIARRAKIVGGHEVCLRKIDVQRERVYGPNSWGSNWGNRGEFWMSFATFGRLLDEDGDATVPTPLDVPAPTPEPPTPPVPAYTAEAFWTEMKGLAAQRGLD